METALMYYIEQDHPYWKPVAWVDESEGCCEVSITEIWRTPEGKFVLATASGCSCWEGEYETEEYDSLDTIVNGILNREGYVYNPSLEGAKKLVEAAKANSENRVS